METAFQSATELETSGLADAGKARIQCHAEDPRWWLACRIVASGSLGRSRLQERFLLFIVDRHIRGREDEITEQQIGILVFDRAEGYDSDEDNIVRSYARNLRRRIESYYAKEGRNEVLLLDIPRGGYVPAFAPRAPSGATRSLSCDREDASLQSDQPPQTDEEEVPSKRSFVTALSRRLSVTSDWFKAQAGYGLALAVSVGIAIGSLAASLASEQLGKHLLVSSTDAASEELWRQIFGSDHDTVVVPSDDGLVIMQRLTVRPLPLADYISGVYRDDKIAERDPGAAEILKLGGRRYTSVVDLTFVERLAQLDAVRHDRMVVRYARDLRMDDLRGGSAVLIGSIESNPWIQLFEPQMNFRQTINTDPRLASGFRNLHPRLGEQDLYGTPSGDHTYGLISYQPNLTSTGHVIVVGGLNNAGTQAATTFLLTPSLMAPTLERARISHDHFRPFELLIGAGAFAANASTPQMVAERIR